MTGCSTVTCQGHPPSETPQQFVSLTLHILADSVSGGVQEWAFWAGEESVLHGSQHVPVSLSRQFAYWAASAFSCPAAFRLQVRSVDDALDLLTASESISGYKPQDGAEPTSATKTVRLQRLPPVLVLFLMRFDPANLRQKIRYGGRHAREETPLPGVAVPCQIAPHPCLSTVPLPRSAVSRSPSLQPSR